MQKLFIKVKSVLHFETKAVESFFRFMHSFCSREFYSCSYQRRGKEKMKILFTLFFLFFAVTAQAATCVVYNMTRNPPRVEVDTLSVYPVCNPLGGAVMTSAEIGNINTQIQTLTAAVAGLPANQTFDPVLAAAFWSFAMTFILGCWLLAKNAGVILSFIRKG